MDKKGLLHTIVDALKKAAGYVAGKFSRKKSPFEKLPLKYSVYEGTIPSPYPHPPAPPRSSLRASVRKVVPLLKKLAIVYAGAMALPPLYYATQPTENICAEVESSKDVGTQGKHFIKTKANGWLQAVTLGNRFDDYSVEGAAPLKPGLKYSFNLKGARPHLIFPFATRSIKGVRAVEACPAPKP